MIGPQSWRLPNQPRAGWLAAPPDNPIVRALWFQWLWAPSNHFVIKRQLRGCRSVLDLGCGPNSILRDMPKRFCSLGVDVFLPYLHASQRRRIHHNYVRADLRRLELREKSFDAVLLLEIIEHLSKSEALRLLSKAESWARQTIIVSTPQGFVQTGVCDGNRFLVHQSGWTKHELEGLGFECWGTGGWRKLYRAEGGTPWLKPMLGGLVLAAISQKITYFFPRSCFGLVAVKRLHT